MAGERYTFVLSDESVNRYGYWVQTGGINLANFERNPIMLWNHARNTEYRAEAPLPIGRWENLRIEGDCLLGDAVFDSGDDFARKIAGKVAAGILNSVSVSFDVISSSVDQTLLKAGQRYATVTGCDLLEVSIVDIPANANAIVRLSALQGGDPPTSIHLLKPIEMENRRDTEMEVAVGRLQEENDRLRSALSGYETREAARETALCQQQIAEAVRAGRLSADQRDHFVELGSEIGSERLGRTLGAMRKATRPSDLIGSGAGSGFGSVASVGALTWDDADRGGKLDLLYKQDRAQFDRMYREKYGKDFEEMVKQ